MSSKAEKYYQAPASEPKSWTRVRLGDICEIVRGVTYKKDQASEQPEKGKVPILRATNIQDSALVLDSDLVYVPSDVVSEGQMLQVGDIVVATSSGSKHLVGKTAQVKEPWAGSFGAFCAVLRPKADIDHRYLGYFFGSREYKDYISAKALGVNINNLRRGDLEEIAVPVAPLDQQKRIVAEIEKQFSRLDEAVANLKRVKANLKRYKAAVLKAAVEGRLVETEAELARKKTPSPLAGEGGGEGASYETGAQLLQRILENRRSQWKGKSKYKEPAAPDTAGLPGLPEGWAWASLDQLTSDSLIGLDRGRDQQNSEGLGVPYVKMNNVTMEGDVTDVSMVYVNASGEEKRRFSLERDDLLFNTRNSKELVGKVGLVRAIPKDSIYNNNLLRIRLADGAIPSFVCSQMCSDGFRRRMELVKKATTNVAAVYAKDLFPLQLAFPPEQEQQRIVAEIDRRLSLVRETEAQVDANITRAARMRQALLSDFFSGRRLTRAREEVV